MICDNCGITNVIYSSMKNKILIATTNDDHRFLLTMLFTDSGFIVDAPRDLSLCFRLFEENEYYKVIVDYDYRSDMNRLFCRYLESHNQFKKSVLIQTITDEEIASKVFEQGGDIINKPYDTKDLLYAVNRV